MWVYHPSIMGGPESRHKGPVLPPNSFKTLSHTLPSQLPTLSKATVAPCTQAPTPTWQGFYVTATLIKSKVRADPNVRLNEGGQNGVITFQIMPTLGWQHFITVPPSKIHGNNIQTPFTLSFLFIISLEKCDKKKGSRTFLWLFLYDFSF